MKIYILIRGENVAIHSDIRNIDLIKRIMRERNVDIDKLEDGEYVLTDKGLIKAKLPDYEFNEEYFLR